MTPRILRLAAQAGLDLSTDNDAYQQFAELILAECCETVREVVREEANVIDWTTADRLQSLMKQNLGVTQWTI